MGIVCRGAPKETRDKANLMTAERKLRQELEETRNELKKVQTHAKTLRKKCNEDEVSAVFDVQSIAVSLLILFSSY